MLHRCLVVYLLPSSVNFVENGRQARNSSGVQFRVNCVYTRYCYSNKVSFSSYIPLSLCSWISLSGNKCVFPRLFAISAGVRRRIVHNQAWLELREGSLIKFPSFEGGIFASAIAVASWNKRDGIGSPSGDSIRVIVPSLLRSIASNDANFRRESCGTVLLRRIAFTIRMNIQLANSSR